MSQNAATSGDVDVVNATADLPTSSASSTPATANTSDITTTTTTTADDDRSAADAGKVDADDGNMTTTAADIHDPQQADSVPQGHAR